MSFQAIKEKLVKARNQYPCSWCNEKIEKGEKHYSRAYIIDGDFNSDRMHEECFEAMERSSYHVVSEGWYPGEFNRGEVVR
jgi:hypothetical protein